MCWRLTLMIRQSLSPELSDSILFSNSPYSPILSRYLISYRRASLLVFRASSLFVLEPWFARTPFGALVKALADAGDQSIGIVGLYDRERLESPTDALLQWARSGRQGLPIYTMPSTTRPIPTLNIITNGLSPSKFYGMVCLPLYWCHITQLAFLVAPSVRLSEYDDYPGRVWVQVVYLLAKQRPSLISCRRLQVLPSAPVTLAIVAKWV